MPAAPVRLSGPPEPARAAIEALRLRLGLPDAFPAVVLAEAEEAAARRPEGYADLTDVEFVTIDPAAAISLLTDAAVTQSSVVIGYVDAAGVATQRVVAPVNVRGGQLTAYDPAAGRVREFAIHRVTSVVAPE